MKNFIDNLRDLIFESEKSLRKLEKESGVAAMQYSRYLNGSVPTIEITLKIAKYFSCSLDFLFGLTEIKNNTKYQTYDYDISQFLKNYGKLLKQNNISHYKFIRNGGYDESIIRHWRAGSIPRLDIIYYIAKNLNGSMDELIGRI